MDYSPLLGVTIHPVCVEMGVFIKILFLISDDLSQSKKAKYTEGSK
jgi:hypothetical protein